MVLHILHWSHNIESCFYSIPSGDRILGTLSALYGISGLKFKLRKSANYFLLSSFWLLTSHLNFPYLSITWRPHKFHFETSSFSHTNSFWSLTCILKQPSRYFQSVSLLNDRACIKSIHHSRQDYNFILINFHRFPQK